MSLWFTLRVNDKAVGSLVIRRVSPRGPLGLIPEDVDVVGTYVVQCDGRDLGQVEHRYGDGPWALVRLALGLLEKRLEKRGCAYAAISLVLSHSHYPIDDPAGTYRGRYPGGASVPGPGGGAAGPQPHTGAGPLVAGASATVILAAAGPAGYAPLAQRQARSPGRFR